MCNETFQTSFFFSLASSYRLQDKQVGHLKALPGGLRVPDPARSGPCEPRVLSVR